MEKIRRCTSVPYKNNKDNKKKCSTPLVRLNDHEGSTYICPRCDSIEDKTLAETYPEDALNRMEQQ